MTNANEILKIEKSLETWMQDEVQRFLDRVQERLDNEEYFFALRYTWYGTPFVKTLGFEDISAAKSTFGQNIYEQMQDAAMDSICNNLMLELENRGFEVKIEFKKSGEGAVFNIGLLIEENRILAETLINGAKKWKYDVARLHK